MPLWQAAVASAATAQMHVVPIGVGRGLSGPSIEGQFCCAVHLCCALRDRKKTEKRRPRASNGQQYPLPYSPHFRFPKCVQQGRGYRWPLLALDRLSFIFHAFFLYSSVSKCTTEMDCTTKGAFIWGPWRTASYADGHLLWYLMIWSSNSWMLAFFSFLAPCLCPFHWGVNFYELDRGESYFFLDLKLKWNYIPT